MGQSFRLGAGQNCFYIDISCNIYNKITRRSICFTSHADTIALEGEIVTDLQSFQCSCGQSFNIEFIARDNYTTGTIQGLSDGHSFSIVSHIEDKNFKENISKIIKKNNNSTILLVEGETDKIILENAWEKLYPEKKRWFDIQNAFDCFFIQNTFLRGDIFINSPNAQFIGIMDFDRAYESYERVKEKDEYKEVENNEQNGLTLKHESHNGYLFLLPIPLNRQDFAGKKFKKYSLLSIEFLFDDYKIDKFMETIHIPFGKIIKIKDNKKSDFAELTKSFSKDDFLNFKIIFEKIEDIIEIK